MNDRLPAQNLDAERSVLGSMLRDNGCIGDVLLALKKDDFYTDAHQKVFAAILALFDVGKPADLVTTFSALVQQDKHADVTPGYLGELWDAAPTSANVSHYARIVHDCSIKRRLNNAASKILADLTADGSPATEHLERAEKAVFAISELGTVGQTVSLGSAINDAFKRIDWRLERSDEAAVPTGFVDLDRLISGLQNGELVLLAARPSQGKTALGLSFTRHIITRHEMPVLFVSLEQSRIELAERLLCAQASVDSQRVRAGKLDDRDMDALVAAAQTLQKGGLLHIDDSPSQSLTRIGANARRLKARAGIRLLVIDYLQLIEPEDRKASEYERLSDISRRLKNLARELNIPVLALAQLNREVEGRTSGRPKLSDLRGSGSLEQDADVVMLLHKGQSQGTVDIINVLVEKQRNGPVGDVPLAFCRPFVRFENYAVGANPYDNGPLL